MFTRLLLCFGFGFTLFACSSGSAPDNHLDRTRLITTLDDSERQEMCASSISALGGEGKQYHCDINGHTLDSTIHSVDNCVASLESLTRCDVTVGELDDCTEAQTQNFCQPGLACASLQSRILACQESAAH